MPATPLSHWLYFHLALVVLLAAELIMAKLIGSATPADTRKKALIATGIWVTAALALAAVLLPFYKTTGSIQYLSGYAIEEALSVDNLFVFLLLFKLFRIPTRRQPRVLFWGVLGAIVLRGAFIAAGLGLLARFHWVGYIFAVILLVAAVRLLKPECETEAEETPAWLRWLTRLHPISENQDHFFVREAPTPGAAPIRMMTVLFLALIAVELTDIVFALDSIPAVLSITRIPFLAYTSNIMAVMGLRSLYVLLAAMLKSLRYMHYGLAALLIFAAAKMLLSDWIEIGPLASLAAIATLLALTVAASLLHPKPTPTP